MTAVAAAPNLRRDLEAAGLGFKIEQIIPEGNHNHARDERYRKIKSDRKRYPADFVREFLNRALAEVEVRTFTAGQVSTVCRVPAEP